MRTRRPAVLRTKRFSLSREKNQEKAAISRLFPRRHGRRRLRQAGLLHHSGGVVLDHLLDAFADGQALEAHGVRPGGLGHGVHLPGSTEERRVGGESVRSCSSRGSWDHKKKKIRERES